MKMVLFDDYKPGLLQGDSVIDVSEATRGVAGRNGQETMQGIIANFDSLRGTLEQALNSGQAKPLSSVKLRAPLPRPGKIMAMGTNFKEFTKGAPLPIWGFFKSPEAVLQDVGGTVQLPPDDFVI